MTITIDSERLARFLADDVHLTSGSGKGANGTIDVCIMQAVHWISGGTGKSDAPDCADPAITRFCRRLNDGERFDGWRDELKPYAPRIAGTRRNKADRILRGFMCADWTSRTFAPLAFEFWADVVPERRAEALSWATRLRGLDEIKDAASALDGRDVAREARKYAAYAANAASAASAASAVYAAYAAYAASAASAASAAYAAYAADAASAASAASAAYAADVRAKADAFARTAWDSALELLDRMIKVTESVRKDAV